MIHTSVPIGFYKWGWKRTSLGRPHSYARSSHLITPIETLSDLPLSIAPYSLDACAYQGLCVLYRYLSF